MIVTWNVTSKDSNSSPVVFVIIQGAQSGERWLPTKGVQGAMGREKTTPAAPPHASLCRALYEDDWGRVRLRTMNAKILNCILVFARNKDNCSPNKCSVIKYRSPSELGHLRDILLIQHQLFFLLLK